MHCTTRPSALQTEEQPTNGRYSWQEHALTLPPYFSYHVVHEQR